MRKCSTCKYRTLLYHGGASPEYICYYIIFKRKRRGCPVDDCTKYEEGDRLDIYNPYNRPMLRKRKKDNER